MGLFADERGWRLPGRALGSLLGPDEEPVARAAAASSEEGLRTWRLAVLTEAAGFYIEAARQSGVWAFGYDDKPAESLTAWAKPLRLVTGVSVESTQPRYSTYSESGWSWTTRYVVNVGGESILLSAPRVTPH